MNKPQIYVHRRVFSASSLLAAVGEVLGKARTDNGLTFTDLGETLGKGDDAAARYVAGACDMPLSTFIRGCLAFGKPFADAALGFAGLVSIPMQEVAASDDSAKIAPAAIGVATLASATCPTSPGGANITDCELLARAAEIDANYALWDELRHRLNAARQARRSGVA